MSCAALRAFHRGAGLRDVGEEGRAATGTANAQAHERSRVKDDRAEGSDDGRAGFPVRQSEQRGSWPRTGPPAFLTQARAMPQGRQSHAERLGLGHGSKAIKSPGHPAGQLQIHRPRLNATLHQVEHPEGKLPVKRMQRIAAEVPRERIAKIEDPPCPPRLLGRASSLRIALTLTFSAGCRTRETPSVRAFSGLPVPAQSGPASEPGAARSSRRFARRPRHYPPEHPAPGPQP